MVLKTGNMIMDDREKFLKRLSEHGMNISPDIIVACDDSDIDIITWFMHFENVNPYLASCSDCADFHAKLCKGGIDIPIICMRKAEKFPIEWENYIDDEVEDARMGGC